MKFHSLLFYVFEGFNVIMENGEFYGFEYIAWFYANI